MTLLFWNLGKNHNEELLCEIIKENNVSIAILSEFVLPINEQIMNQKLQKKITYNKLRKLKKDILRPMVKWVC